jgi:hypothetical protein
MGGVWDPTIEYPHGLHSNTFTSSANGWLIVRLKVIGRPQTKQRTSMVGSSRPVIRCQLRAAGVFGLVLSQFAAEEMQQRY